MDSGERGREAESTALIFLKKQGLGLLSKNWRCRLGELDLVMQDRDTVVFIEVRYRRSSRFGGAISSVDSHKQKKLARAALQFLQQHPALSQKNCRFDVLALSASMPIEWIKNAFELPADYA